MAEPQQAVNNSDDKEWLTRSEVAERVGLSLSTVDRAIANGDLETRGKGRRRRSRPAWVDAWVNTWVSSVLVLLATLLALFVACALGMQEARQLLDVFHCPHV